MAGHCKSNDTREHINCARKKQNHLSRTDPFFKSGKASPTMKSFLQDLSPTTRLGVIPPPQVKLQACRNRVPIYSSGKVFKCQNHDFRSPKNGTITNYNGIKTAGTVSKKVKGQPKRSKITTHYNMTSVYKEVTSRLRAENRSQVKNPTAISVKDNSMQTPRIKSAFGRLESTIDASICGGNVEKVEVKPVLKGSGKKNGSKVSSKTFLRRPTSSVTTKQESAEYCKKWEDRSKCDLKTRSTFLQEKPLKTKVQIGEPIAKGKPSPVNIEPELKPEFNVQGSSIPKHSSGMTNKDDEESKSDEISKNLKIASEEDFIKNSAEDVELIENSGACFLTEMVDSPRDSGEYVIEPVTDIASEKSLNPHTVKAWDNNIDKTEVTNFNTSDSSTVSLKSDFRHGGRNQNKMEPVKPNVINLEIDEDQETKEDTGKTDSFPYKLETQPVCEDPVTSEERIYNTYLGRQLPQSLGPLMDFLCNLEDSEKLHHLTGIRPESCLIFIPDIDCYDLDTLNEVPSIQHVDDDLPYTERVVSPVSKVPKKFHLSKPTTLPKWQKRYSSASLHKTRVSGPKRTISTVRKEISDLENVVKGVVCDENESIMMKFQADIAKLRTTVKSTLAKVPSDKPPSSKSNDQFGLRKFYKEHDIKMDKLRKQHASCLEELAKLEVEADLPEQSRKFSKQICVVATTDNDMFNTENLTEEIDRG